MTPPWSVSLVHNPAPTESRRVEIGSGLRNFGTSNRIVTLTAGRMQPDTTVDLADSMVSLHVNTIMHFETPQFCSYLEYASQDDVLHTGGQRLFLFWRCDGAGRRRRLSGLVGEKLGG
jgi:hypothetical protein